MKTIGNFKVPLLVIFLCILTAHCVGHNSIQIIGTGGTCFIGESGLDISEPVPDAGTQLGWWPTADHSTIPSKIITINDPLNFFVDPVYFVGYVGDWYVWPAKTLAFNVQDPHLDLSIEDVTTATDITNGIIVPGDEIGFRINSNLYNGDPGTPVSINVTAPDGHYYSVLVNKSGIETQLNDILVSSEPFHTGAVWDTLNTTYIRGVYQIQAECNLNGMKDNYNYIGKTVSPNRTITISIPNKIGVFRPSTHLFYLDFNGNGAWNGPVTDRSYNFGITGDIPIIGDWNNNKITKIGVFRPSTHLFYLDFNGNGAWNGAVTDRSYNFGITGDIPVTGDWNSDGIKEIGVFRPSTHLFYLDFNGNGAWNGAVTDRSYNFGITGDIPVTGDWNSDGRTEIGVFRNSTHLFYLDLNGNGAWNGAVTDRSYNFGITGDIPVTGDWNNNKIPEIGVFRPSTHLFYLDYNGNGIWNGAVTDRSYNFGITGDIPISGKWS